MPLACVARNRVTIVVSIVLSMISIGPNLAVADDWPQWGGPRRDLVWREKGIVKKLPTDELLPRVWSTPIGAGYSGPAVADGRVYITDFQGNRRGKERILCLDAETGTVIWKKEYAEQYTISYPAGPRTTPVIDDGRVYTIGAMGKMFCLSVEKGEEIWSKDFIKDYKTKMPMWGMASAPLIDGNQCITLVGGPDNALLVSFDKRTGEELWRSLNDRQIGYCPPLIFKFGPTRQLIIWHPTAISSLDPKNGEVIWEVPFSVRYGLTIPTPRKQGNRLFVTSFYNGPRMLEVAADGRSAKMLWSGSSDSETNTDGLHSIMPTPVLTSTHIFGICSHGQLRCLDAATGDRVWESLQATGKGRWWNAFIIPHEDRYFIHNEQGDLIIANLSPKGYEEISRAKLVEPTRKVGRRMTIWSHPAFAMQSVFARNDKEIVRVNLAAD